MEINYKRAERVSLGDTENLLTENLTPQTPRVEGTHVHGNPTVPQMPFY
jgi:hypothetical protein